MCSLASCIAQNPKEMKKERLTYFSFDHHNTMVWHSGEKYTVSTEKDGRIHIIIDEGFPEEKDFYIDDTTIFDELDSLIKAFKMHKWHDKYQPKMEIFDGDSWSLYFKYGSKKAKARAVIWHGPTTITRLVKPFRNISKSGGTIPSPTRKSTSSSTPAETNKDAISSIASNVANWKPSFSSAMLNTTQTKRLP